MSKAPRMAWALSELAELWGLSRQTVLKYVKHGKLNAWQHTEKMPYYVTDAERLRFERDVRPTLKPGRPAGSHRASE